MKAIQFYEYGDVETMHLVNIPSPAIGPTEILIRVRASGVNPSDWKRRQGVYQAYEKLTFPAGVGVEASGVVEAVGENLSNSLIGKSVFGFGRNTAAELAILSHWAELPPNVSFELAACTPVVFETASRSLAYLAMQADETLFVSGASGGVGSAVVQLALAHGVNVVGSCSHKNSDYLRALGAMPVIYGDGLNIRIRRVTEKTIDAVLHVAGVGIIPELIELVGDPYKVVSVSDFGAIKYGARFCKGPPENPSLTLSALAEMLACHKLKMPIEKKYPLADIAKAHQLSEKGHVTGKIILTIGK